MSNTWDTVFEEGFSSVPVCNNCTIIYLLVLQALTVILSVMCPFFCYFKYCCIHLVVYLCDVSVFCIRFNFFFIKVITDIFNKRYFASLTCVFLFAALFQLEPSSFAFRTFFRQKKSQRRNV
jgi:hypothetical protein